MTIHELTLTPSILSVYLSEIRDVSIQKDSMRFRKNLERIAELMAYEISKELSYQDIKVQSPLGIANADVLVEQPVLATVLRAGLSMHSGFLKVFDKSDSAFISAYRTEVGEGRYKVDIEYVGVPSFENKVVIIIDPMLATGSSMIAAYQTLLKYGRPKKIIMAVTIATPDAIDFLNSNIDENITLYTCVIDKKLNEHGYIIPGLGDAGDLAYGVKI